LTLAFAAGVESISTGIQIALSQPAKRQKRPRHAPVGAEGAGYGARAIIWRPMTGLFGLGFDYEE
jgi:hypothetical protein